MSTPAWLGACPIYTAVEGSPYQPGDLARVVRIIDSDSPSAEPFVGRSGRVVYLEYSCGCGQSYPGDPMIGIDFGDRTEEFWPVELEKLTAA